MTGLSCANVSTVTVIGLELGTTRPLVGIIVKSQAVTR